MANATVRAPWGSLECESEVPVSAVDKKLMDQMLRFAKIVVVTSANARAGATTEECAQPGKRDAQYMRAIMERGIRTLPLEQRILSEAGFEKRAFDLGRMYVIRELGIWEMMSYGELHRESEYVAFPELMDGLVEEGLVKLVSLEAEEQQQEICMLTEAGKELFAKQEQALDKRADELFGNLTEAEKVQLYLLLRKVMGSPAFESDQANEVRRQAGIA